ncbi:MAG: ATP-dependent ligase, partial [Acidobacteria bacterium]|nr:ATP-dependent ligase [Acidobacteriota bacterium]
NPSTASDSEIGSLLLGVVESDGELHFAGKVGTGFSSRLRSELRKQLDRDRLSAPPVKGAPRMRDVVWTKPRLVAQVRFTEWTSDGMLRHPSFLGLRTDKTPMECVRETRGATPTAAAAIKENAMKKVPAGTKRTSAKKSTKVSSKAAAKPAAKNDRALKAVPPAAPVKKTPATKSSAKKAGAAGKAPTIVLTNPDRILYPRDGYTKQDLADYYEAVSGPMITALRDRPLSLEHWNQGISKGSWFHQNIADGVEDWMTIIETPTRTSDKDVKHFVADSRQAMRWLAQRSVLTVHMWASRGEALESPDWLVFDLDPAKGKGIEQAIDAALIMRRLLDHLEVPSYPKTSGKRGIHLFVPLEQGYTHDDAADFACNVAAAVTSKFPDMTVERALVKRRGRLYLDCMQNAYGKTIVAPYSPRGIDGAPVSAPLEWSEVTKKLDPLKYTIKTMPARLAKKGDLFAPVLKKGIKLPTLK